jgi:DNA-binding transcriptional ArsR family regulator
LTAGIRFDIFTFVETSQALAALAALAQETRLAVYRLLLEHAPEGLPAGQVADRLQLLPASLSFHLKELSRAGLVGSRQKGRFVWYRADLEAMNGLVAYLTENCCKSGVACVAVCAPKVRPATRTKRRPTATAARRSP